MLLGAAFSDELWVGLGLGNDVSWSYWVTALISLTVLAAMLQRLALWAVYRPVTTPPLESREPTGWPTVVVVIPAYNEGAMVRVAIDSVLASDYPSGQLSVIVVDDGSTDSTAEFIAAAVNEHGHSGRLTAVTLERNGGKRHALYRGFKTAAGSDTGDPVGIVATVDSDTLVRPDAIRALVAPILADGRVGGVAGKILVHNRFDNVLTRMLGVRYILGFDFIRAYQSVLRTVWCCPGALQAYRLEVISPHLEDWRDQKFLGAQCTNGDDHAMSNLVLSLGFDTVYQSSAAVETKAPRTYWGLCNMYVRWGRSATREGLRALRFTPRRCARLGPWRGPLVLVDALLQPLTILARIGGLGAVLWLLVTDPLAIVGVLGGVVASAVLYGLIYLRSERSIEVVFGMLYALFAVICLPWVQPFATLTVRRNGWLTRD